MATPDDPRLRAIADLLERRADGHYGLHEVTQRQHALQAAWLAERQGCDAALVTAALLHDVGHLVHDLGQDPARPGWTTGTRNPAMPTSPPGSGRR